MNSESLLLTSRAQVLKSLTEDNITIRSVSHSIGLTERRVVEIIRELEEHGLLVVTRRGRQNHYALSEGSVNLIRHIDEIAALEKHFD